MALAIARIPSSRARWRRRAGGLQPGTLVRFAVTVTDDSGATSERQLAIRVLSALTFAVADTTNATASASLPIQVN